ncbi:MAG: c-type cytochrome [Rubripirellula sp.]
MPSKTLMILFVLLSSFYISGNADDALRARNDAIIVRALERIDDHDLEGDVHAMAALNRHLDRVVGTQEYLTLVKKFKLAGREDELLGMIRNSNSDNLKTQAAELLLGKPNGKTYLSNLLRSEDSVTAKNSCRILGILGNDASRTLLLQTITNTQISFEVRQQAIVGVAKNGVGQNSVLKLAMEQTLPADMRLLAGGMLARSNDVKIQERAKRLLPQPQMKDSAPLPPIDQLASLKGNIGAGKELFEGKATCSNCHIVNQLGKNVGPDLSEIGSKLSREAMYTAILDPSAGISHNYENFSVLTLDGQVISGLKVSETDQVIVIRTADAVDRRIPKTEVDVVKKSDKSIMPENLHHSFDQKGLIDLVEYMTSLTKS